MRKQVRAMLDKVKKQEGYEEDDDMIKWLIHLYNLVMSK